MRKTDGRMQEDYWDLSELQELGLRDQDSQLFKLQISLFLLTLTISLLGPHYFLSLLRATAGSLQLLLTYLHYLLQPQATGHSFQQAWTFLHSSHAWTPDSFHALYKEQVPEDGPVVSVPGARYSKNNGDEVQQR